MNSIGFIAVGIGATLGAWLRWALAVWLNQMSLNVPTGTLVANLGGGFVIGGALAFFGAHTELHPAWRLFLVTGFLGGLTTFSTFSAESLTLLQRGEFLAMVGHSAIHILGSLACCALGYYLCQKLMA